MQPVPPASRLPSIDAFRGLAVLMMAAINYIAGIGWMPAWLKHAPDIGYTVADVVAPMFIIAIGLTIGPAARRRMERQGAAAALGGMAIRYFAILGIGAIISAGEGLLLHDGSAGWGVLQAIGAAGLLALAVIFLPPWMRVLTGLALLGGYQWLLDTFFLNVVLASPHNGIIGSLSWGGLMILASAVADLFFQAKAPAKRALVPLLCGSGALDAGVILSLWFPVAKNRASISYMLVSLGLCLLVFLLAHGLLDGRPARLKGLLAVGKNPLVMYITHLLLLGIVTLPNSPQWYAQAPWWLAAAQGLMIISVLVLFGLWLENRKILIKI
jgi:alpha-N-acetylglucosaminidase